MEVLINKLNQLALDFNLISKAIDGAKSWVSSEDFDIENTITAKFQYEFHVHKLCFKHEYKDLPYIETILNITLDEDDIGYYCWHTTLDGETIDDVLVITDHELKYS